MNIPPSPLQRIPPAEQHMILNNQTVCSFNKVILIIII